MIIITDYLEENTLGENIRRLRKQNGMSARELAALVGLKSPQAVLQYERNEREPNIKMIQHLAHVLNVPVSSLIGEQKAIEEGIMPYKSNLSADDLDKLADQLTINNMDDLERVREILLPDGIPQEPVDYFREVLKHTLGAPGSYDPDEVSDEKLKEIIDSLEFKTFLQMLMKSFLNK